MGQQRKAKDYRNHCHFRMAQTTAQQIAITFPESSEAVLKQSWNENLTKDTFSVCAALTNGDVHLWR